MKIVVLAGGISTERTVSLVSGTGVCQALRRKGHQEMCIRDRERAVNAEHGTLPVMFCDDPGHQLPEGNGGH